MTHRQSLLCVIVASAVLSCLAGACAMYLSTHQFEQAASQAKLKQIGHIVNRLVNEGVWQQHTAAVGALARDVAQEAPFKNAVAQGSAENLKGLLPEAWRRLPVTSGQIALFGVTVHSLDGTVIAAHATEENFQLGAELGGKLAKRQSNDRLQMLTHIWTAQGRPRLSVVVPVGGLRLAGYLALHADPLRALQGLDDRLGMEVAFRTADGAATIAKLDKFKLPTDVTALKGSISVNAPGTGPLFQIDIKLDETEENSTLASIRTWSLAVLVGLLAVVAASTLLLVLLISRRMAQDEAQSAEAALRARQEADAAQLRARRDAEAAQAIERRRAEEETINRERAIVSTSIGAAMARLAEKDLTFRLEEELPEAYAKLQSDFNYALEQIEEAVQGVRASTGAIGSGTREISSSADDLSQRTEQQAASLEETAAALDEITATVKKAAEGAAHARDVVASRQGRCREERRGRAPGGRGHGRHREVVAADQPDHRRDRRDRLPDQPAGAQRRRRGRACRRGRPRLRGGRLRGARARAALGAMPPRRSRA